MVRIGQKFRLGLLKKRVIMKILQPIAIGGVIFKNSIMFPPLTTGYEAKDGSISDVDL